MVPSQTQELIKREYRKALSAKEEADRVNKIRGLIVEDHVYFKLGIPELCTKYQTTRGVIAKILMAYEDNSPITIRLVPKSQTIKDEVSEFSNLHEFMDYCEEIFLREKLKNHVHISDCAKAVGIQRSHLYVKINKYGIVVKQK